MPEKDEHGCIIGDEFWDPISKKCVPLVRPPGVLIREAREKAENEKLPPAWRKKKA